MLATFCKLTIGLLWPAGATRTGSTVIRSPCISEVVGLRSGCPNLSAASSSSPPCHSSSLAVKY